MSIKMMIPGPLHPDLFGGDTPIMTPVDVDVYCAELSCIEHVVADEALIFLADPDDDLEAVAQRIAQKEYAGQYDEIRVDEIEQAGDDEITDAVKAAFLERHQIPVATVWRQAA